MFSEIPSSNIVDAKIKEALTNHPTKKDVDDAIKSKQDALTQSQINAVNSGVTGEHVEKLNNIEEGAQKNPDLSPYAKKTELPVVPDMSKYALNEKVESEEVRAREAERIINLKVEAIVGGDTGKSARTIAGEEVTKIVGGAPETYDTLKEIAEYIESDKTGAAAMAASIKANETAIARKVDKVEGKGLSTSDFTPDEKTKLAGIAAGAEVNVQANWSQTNSSKDDYIKNKPTALSRFSNDLRFVSRYDIIHLTPDNKGDVYLSDRAINSMDSLSTGNETINIILPIPTPSDFGKVVNFKLFMPATWYLPTLAFSPFDDTHTFIGDDGWNALDKDSYNLLTFTRVGGLTSSKNQWIVSKRSFPIDWSKTAISGADGFGLYTLPADVTQQAMQEIGYGVQTDNWYGLTGIVFPEGTTTLEDGLFACWAPPEDPMYCHLKRVVIPSSVKSLGILEWGMGLFTGCRDLCDVTLPEGLETIGNYAFMSCSSLSTIALPSTLTTIGEYAFSEAGLTGNLKLNEGITTIRTSAFSYMPALESVELPSSWQLDWESLGGFQFAGCIMLQSVYFANANEWGYRDIPPHCFYGCSALTTVTFDTDNPLITVNNNTFGWCTSLAKIELGRGSYITSVMSYNPNTGMATEDSGAFYNCTSLTEITIGGYSGYYSSYIDSYAFNGCTSLSHVDIIADATSLMGIGPNAFYGCPSLMTVTILNVATSDVQSVDYASWGLPFGASIICADGTITIQK